VPGARESARARRAASEEDGTNAGRALDSHVEGLLDPRRPQSSSSAPRAAQARSGSAALRYSPSLSGMRMLAPTVGGMRAMLRSGPIRRKESDVADHLPGSALPRPIRVGSPIGEAIARGAMGRTGLRIRRRAWFEDRA